MPRKPTGRRHRPLSNDRSDLELFLRETDEYPLLTKEQEISLAQRKDEGDQAARDMLILSNLRLAIFASKKFLSFVSPSVTADDILQEAMSSLECAAQKYDWKRGFRFSTYAMTSIKRNLSKMLLGRAQTVRIPVQIWKNVWKYRRVRATLWQQLGREPTVSEIAEMAEFPMKKALFLEKVHRKTVVASGEDNERNILTHLQSEDSSVGAHTAQSEWSDELRATLVREIESVFADKPHICQVVIMRFGLAGKPPATLEAIAQTMSCTKERIRQLQDYALKKLAESDNLRELFETRQYCN